MQFPAALHFHNEDAGRETEGYQAATELNRCIGAYLADVEWIEHSYDRWQGHIKIAVAEKMQRGFGPTSGTWNMQPAGSYRTLTSTDESGRMFITKTK